MNDKKRNVWVVEGALLGSLSATTALIHLSFVRIPPLISTLCIALLVHKIVKWHFEEREIK